MAVDHYMVDYEDENGVVQFAGDELRDLTKAMALASETSKKHRYASVVAFELSATKPGTFEGVGAVMFAGGFRYDSDGRVQ